jgi:hypothetical protein
MPEVTVMPPLGETMGHWHDFYALLGTASATMVGLLFVGASVATGVFSADRRAALRVFLSATVVNFGLIMTMCLVVLAPVRSWILLGVLIAGCGLFGLAHSGLAWRDTMLDGLIKKIDLEDRTWYIALPLAGYLLVTGSGVALALQPDIGCAVLALSVGVLLAVGLHNAWDITLWIITRRRE